MPSVIQGGFMGKRIPLRGWLVRGKDDALIEWWEGLGSNENKNQILVEALEMYRSLPPSQRRDPLRALQAEIVTLKRMIQDMSTIIGRQILDQMDAYMAKLPGKRLEDTQPMIPLELEPEEPKATEEELRRRRENRRRNAF
jgi:hypothetical protein